MKIIFYFLAASFLVLSKDEGNVIIDKEEARKAFDFLNDIRTNPAKYYGEFEFLKTTEVKKTRLSWNDTLAKVAEAKAFDMADRNYYGHVDPEGYGMNYFINKSGYKLNSKWLQNKSENYFESIAAGSAGGEQVIRTFVIDKGVPSLGHRNHLLGVGDWNASLVDIGIGFVRRESGSTYKTYISVIIAKHDW
jgi:uncharacterized protein YkwD